MQAFLKHFYSAEPSNGPHKPIRYQQPIFSNVRAAHLCPKWNYCASTFSEEYPDFDECSRTCYPSFPVLDAETTIAGNALNIRYFF